MMCSVDHPSCTSMGAYSLLVRDAINGGDLLGFDNGAMTRRVHPTTVMYSGSSCSRGSCKTTSTSNTSNTTKSKYVDLSGPATNCSKAAITHSGTNTGSCSGGSCSVKPNTTTGSVPRANVPVMFPTSITPIQPPIDDLIKVLIYGDRARTQYINAALSEGYNNFTGRDHARKTDWNVQVQLVFDHNDLDRVLRSEHGFTTIISYGNYNNDVLRAASAHNYTGSLILIGGATDSNIDVDVQVPDSVASVILTHGFGNGNLVISYADYEQIVGSVPSWVYANHTDDALSASLLCPYRRRTPINRIHRHAYLMELVRALKMGGDFTNYLSDKFETDHFVDLNPWT